MKKGKLLLALAIVLLICISLYALTLLLNREPAQQEQTDPTLTVVHSASVEDITAFTLTNTAAEHRFERQDAGWVYNDDTHFPLKADFVNTTLEALSTISAIQVIEYETDDLSAYGLDDPQMTLTLEQSQPQAQTTRFLIGDYNSFNGYYYMTVEGVEDIFIIDSKLVDLCGSEEKDMIQKDSLPETFSADKITGFTVCYGQDELAIAQEDDLFETLTDAAGRLSLTDYEKYYLSEEDYAEYGFDQPIEVLIAYADTVTNEDDATTTSITSAVNYEYTLRFGSTVGESIYFQVEDSDILYRIAAEDLMDLEMLIDKFK